MVLWYAIRPMLIINKTQKGHTQMTQARLKPGGLLNAVAPRHLMLKCYQAEHPPHNTGWTISYLRSHYRVSSVPILTPMLEYCKHENILCEKYSVSLYGVGFSL